MSKLTESIRASWNMAINWFVTLPWWLQLLIVSLILVIIARLIIDFLGWGRSINQNG